MLPGHITSSNSVILFSLVMVATKIDCINTINCIYYKNYIYM